MILVQVLESSKFGARPNPVMVITAFKREVTEKKSRRADLNRWPADYESAALPAELRRQKNAHPLGVSNSGKEKKDQRPRGLRGRSS